MSGKGDYIIVRVDFINKVVSVLRRQKLPRTIFFDGMNEMVMMMMLMMIN